MEPEILIEDASVVVINKPSGMVVNNALSTKDVTVQQWFERKLQIPNPKAQSEFWDKGGVVHRLDKDTSGVMILAKTPIAYERLKTQFVERKVKKEYVALVHGIMQEKKGIIAVPIDRHPVIKTKFAVSDNLSRMAITEWFVKREWKNYSLLELKPLTGRTHQLRVHLQHLGHPIVSDRIYGSKKQLRRDMAWCPRLFLHARKLEIDGMTYEAAMPEVLQRVLDCLVHYICD